jgi:UDP-glucose 4-epimerase
MIRPASPYGLSKAVAEDYVRLYSKAYGLGYVILRYANVYGPRQDPSGEAGVISIFIDRMLKKKKPDVFGPGTQTRDFVFVGDIALANMMAMKAPDGVYNIGSGKETSVLEIFNDLNDVLGCCMAPNHLKPKQEIGRFYFNVHKAREVLGWKERTSLREGLERTVEYFRGRK